MTYGSVASLVNAPVVVNEDERHDTSLHFTDVFMFALRIALLDNVVILLPFAHLSLDFLRKILLPDHIYALLCVLNFRHPISPLPSDFAD